jgi:hypothetical protein
MSMPSEYGIFEPVFEAAYGHGYTLLLHAKYAVYVDRVRDCCLSTDDPFPDICWLLESENWRPHLVAATAVVVCGYRAEPVRLLWRRLDRGSWVAPQIAAALSIVDPEFVERARERLEAGCPQDSSDLSRMSSLERHVAAGPAGTLGRSGKSAAALLRVVQMRSPPPEWLENVVASADFQTLLREDVDQLGGIAEGWSRQMKEILSSDEFDSQKG